MLMSAKNLLDKNPEPTVHEIKDALSGNLCRCTGYTKIIEAIQEAGRAMTGAGAAA
jgi:carbon-monoxide dehydrogenase small subunit